MPANPPKSLHGRFYPATIAGCVCYRTIIELDDESWNGLALGLGDRCMIETQRGDVCSGEVTERRVVTVAIAIGAAGDRVRIRRPLEAVLA